MRVLVTTMPGLGGFQPMIPLCHALRDAGHDVVVAIAPSYTEFARRAGLDAVAAGPNWTFEEADRFMPGFTSMRSRDGMAALAENAKRGGVEDLVELTESWNPDVILHGHHDLAGWIAGELRGIPNVPFAMTIRSLDPGLLRMFAERQVSELLEMFGLPPDPTFSRPVQWLYLDTSPRALTQAMYPAPPTVHHIRYTSDDTRGGDASLPAWVDGLDGRALVYVTTGTVFNRTGNLLPTLARGAAAHDVEVLVTTGQDVGRADLGDLPDNVHVEHYVPQTLVIPRCRAVVCHGSASNVFGALAAGVPLVLAPVASDQPATTWLCVQAGVGISCANAQALGEVFPVTGAEELTHEQVADAVGAVLTSDSYAAAAREVATSIQSDPPVAYGVTLIEQLVATGAPVGHSPG